MTEAPEFLIPKAAWTMSSRIVTDEEAMSRAFELARRGVGFVEPNPAVGAVVVSDDGRIIGEGFHERFGGPHAEVNALAVAGDAARGASLFVTLEPCCHFGKTPPCSRAVIAAGVRRVVVSVSDPAAHVNGGGIAELKGVGIEVVVGLMVDEGQRLIAPFAKLMTRGLPWVHGKWAMTLDGRIASATGSSQWITNELSRAIVHELRGRMDAVIIGVGTALADDPLLTARPAGPRVATRVVLDSLARTPVSSKLVQTARQAPVLLFVTSDAPVSRCDALRSDGVEVFVTASNSAQQCTQPVGQNVQDQSIHQRLDVCDVLTELGRRRMTNVLVEGGSAVLGSFFDKALIDEVHAFIAPKLIGGAASPGPLGGTGIASMPSAVCLASTSVREFEGDVYINGRVAR